MIQLTPFHTSASVPAADPPTAVQVVGDVHEALYSAAPPCGGLAVAWIVQVAPFHASASVPASDQPTAVQVDSEMHETEFRTPPATSGVAWMVQEIPSHA